jgi:hypothetical protein
MVHAGELNDSNDKYLPILSLDGKEVVSRQGLRNQTVPTAMRSEPILLRSVSVKGVNQAEA